MCQRNKNIAIKKEKIYIYVSLAGAQNIFLLCMSLYKEYFPLFWIFAALHNDYILLL